MKKHNAAARQAILNKDIEYLAPNSPTTLNLKEINGIQHLKRKLMGNEHPASLTTSRFVKQAKDAALKRQGLNKLSKYADAEELA